MHDNGKNVKNKQSSQRNFLPNLILNFNPPANFCEREIRPPMAHPHVKAIIQVGQLLSLALLPPCLGRLLNASGSAGLTEGVPLKGDKLLLLLAAVDACSHPPPKKERGLCMTVGRNARKK